MIRFVVPCLGAGCAVLLWKGMSTESPVVNHAPVDFTQSSVSQVFNQNCGKCHGMNGEGGGGGTKTLLTLDKFDQKWDKPFFDAIKNGVKDMGMEAYGQTMNDATIWSLVVHIRELQAQALRSEYGSPKEVNGAYRTKLHNYRVETVVERDRDLTTPWAVDWLPDGKMLVTYRPGQMIVVDKGKTTQVENMPPSVEMGQGGLMEVAVHPNYKANGWIYLAVNDPASGGRGAMTKIVRGKLQMTGSTARWTSQQTIFAADPSTYVTSGVHFGSRIAFDGKGHVFFAIGERGSGERAQDLGRPNGKVYRVNEDGTIPADNPFVGREGAIKAIWSYGHRNPQGLVFDLQGNLWDTEHAPRGGDEVNLIKKGANYGWPNISFGINYNDSPFRTPWPKAGENYAMPAFRWLPSIGACGLDVARGSGFAKWKGDLLAGGLSGNNVDRLRMKDGKLVEREEILHKMGRVRDVAYGPDGHIYVVLNGPDKVIRLVEAR
ncbi:MAG TPA: PQQ-dependent sugar dehydrogenase [Fimbriimonadaceae bacterium]|nr:PQQ-dependent sugar dehydrogenase [Fimbriimonadaceae bacterium]